ncbi:glycerol-3-phosphate acyltransferase 2, mitochondrial [Callorhinchus milii]|uniref:glycerol-3-phosphate acyltransferase 2, mitochondrial n=1 Tax=Callorhinchus milii TaxID=7868 RepID=UPI001C3FAFAA|nr:glycerol-3-phosphate acyltransferase 2, mitochondrial [Callorhinchus milii]
MAAGLDRGGGPDDLTSARPGPGPRADTDTDTTRTARRAGASSSVTLTAPPREASLFLGNTRPFVGRCCYICTPQSWGLLFHNYLTLLGFRNAILVTETHTRYRGWLARRLSYFLFIRGRTVYPGDICDLEEKIINSTRVQKAIQGSLSNRPSPDHKSIQEVKKKVQRIMDQIRAVISPLLLRSQIPAGPPPGYLHLVLSQCEGPYLTGGEDIRLPLLRSLLRRLGGIFIPQMAKGAKSSYTEDLNQAVLTSYIEELLRGQENLQLYLEEAVPRSVRPSLTGMVWLTCVFKAFQSKVIPDAALVPVGISYDRIIEGGCLEQTDPDSISLWAALCWMLGFVRRRYGCVRVDFGQPFSLKDYIENEGIRLRSSTLPLRELLLPCMFGSSSDAVYYERSQDWILTGEGLPQLDRRQQQLVTGLGRHLLYTATSCSAIMSTTIMASLLLQKHRQGTLLSVLARDFQWLTEEVLARHFDVGFSGQLRDVVLHALYLLRDCVTLRNFPLNDLLVTPKPTRRAVRELSVYSRGILPVFIYEAVAACALNSLLRQVANCVTDWESNIEVAISQEEITFKSIQLCHLLPSEILLLPPCRSTYQFAQEAVDKLAYCEILVMEENENKRPACDMWNRRFSKELSWKVTEDSDDSDSDCEAEFSQRYFKLGQSSESHECFLFLCALLEPVIKAYGRAMCFLQRLDSPKPESEFVLELQQYLETQAEERGAYESATLDLAHSAVRTFKEVGVLREEPGVTGPVLAFSDIFLQPENRQTLQDYIQQFSC